MIRLFDWRDVALLRRVRKDGLCMYARMGCTRGPNALRNALREILPTGRRGCTMVYRPDAKDERAAVGQICHSGDQHHARIAFIGPEEVLGRPNGVHLLDALVEAAGMRGAHQLLAEVNEDSHAFESLREASFAIYARQRIWRLIRVPSAAQNEHSGAWRRMRYGDSPAVQALYHSLVPPLVQQIEPPPSRDPECLVHWEQDALTAYLQIERGPLGTWVQPFFHPSVDSAEDLLSPVLRQFRIDRNRPLYLCVRSYHGWMNGMLDRLGFEDWQDQAVMVKHLVAKIRKPVLAPLRTLEGTRPEPTSPIMRTENRRSGNRVREST
jgi:hypothetical protein